MFSLYIGVDATAAMNINGFIQLKQQVFSEEGKQRGEIENKPLYIE